MEMNFARSLKGETRVRKNGQKHGGKKEGEKQESLIVLCPRMPETRWLVIENREADLTSFGLRRRICVGAPTNSALEACWGHYFYRALVVAEDDLLGQKGERLESEQIGPEL